MNEYNTLLFDCDGVILDSNSIKTNAFYQAALPYGEGAATELVRHHKKNGGVSRYLKFAYFLEHITPVPGQGPSLSEMLDTYAECVKSGLQTCQIAPGLEDLRDKTPNARWIVVSGGDQNELRQVFADRGISHFFDGGIFGSPDTKEEILTREKENGNITGTGIFLGDSAYDSQAAEAASIDFVFVSDWTELDDWNNWCKARRIRSIPNIGAHGEIFSIK